MRTVGMVLLGLLIGLSLECIGVAQDEIVAEIQKTDTPPVIDGLGDDVVWSKATAHGMDEFFTSAGTEELEDDTDLSVTWKALWDDANLYVLMEITDDEIINDEECNWNDDSAEIYIDAQNLDVSGYEVDPPDSFPAYQFTAIAGNNPSEVCGEDRMPDDGTSPFSWGINSYNDGDLLNPDDDELDHYPRQSDTGVNAITDVGYNLEVSFPWDAIEETPENILARGDMGFGIAVNDDDFGGSRQTQVYWQTELSDLWNVSASFPSVALSTETVSGDGEVKPQLLAGDADQDLDFDQLDLVKVQIAAKYLTGQAATWGDGDWNGAPGGEQGSPPAGNGFFDQLDIIAALGPGHYLSGPYAALAGPGTAGDGQTSLVYDSNTGELSVDAPAGKELTSINITSASSKFIGDKPAALDGAFDNFAADNVFKATFGGSFGSITFGNVLPASLGEAEVTADLSAVGSLAGGGDLGAVDLIYIPEPSALAILALGAVGILLRRRR